MEEEEEEPVKAESGFHLSVFLLLQNDLQRKGGVRTRSSSVLTPPVCDLLPASAGPL